MKPPLRLLDDPGAPAALRSDLARLKAADPGFDAAAGLRAFEAAAAATAVTGGAGAVGSLVGAILKGALLGVLAVGAAAAASVYQDRQQTPTASVATAAPVTAPLRAEPERAPAPPPEPARSASQPAPPRPAASAAPSADPPAERAEAENGLAAEVDNLSRARGLLASSPAETLALADEGHRRFAQRGSLYPEREMLAITALFQLGRRDQARERAARFLAAYPESPFGERLRQLAGVPQNR